MPFGFHRKDKDKEKSSAPTSPISPTGQYQPNHYHNFPSNLDPRAGAPFPGQPQPPLPPGGGGDGLDAGGFRMYRSTTTTQEEIFAPTPSEQQIYHEKSLEKKKDKDSKRRSFNFRKDKYNNNSSDRVPTDLINADEVSKEQEDRWEWRASQLGIASGGVAPAPRERSRSRSISDQGTDKDIQEAIRLHEAGDLENSTKLFKQLADPNGANNPLSQVLYGLALRHGWGCQPDSAAAIKYLQAAAANSANIEQEALRAGMKKGGAAKGELVLAIFELGNCFRHGWGTEQDPVAAFNYYQTAANLGDTDAMNETAWCYLNGYGMKKKDKYQAAKYYRLAEENGNKTVGNSWIYKDKYVNPQKK
ncbi:hypothetical protein ABW19_dt0208261 [Dactylella cylindrospora]|nr:hypothetical protein ABW19_dt0208261 [Dactylella cylindrospora]